VGPGFAGQLKVAQVKLRNKLFALYQGTTLVVPPLAKRQGFSPCSRRICTKFQLEKAQGLKSLRENSCLPIGSRKDGLRVAQDYVP
jgi:hypothetical protein